MYRCQYCNARFHGTDERDEHEAQDACELPDESHTPYRRANRSSYHRRYGVNEVRYDAR